MKQTAERVFRHTLAAIDIPAALARKLQRSDSRISRRHCRDRSSRLQRNRGHRLRQSGLRDGGRLDCHSRARFCSWTASSSSQRRLSARFLGGKHSSAAILYPRRKVSLAGRAILERLARCGERTLIFFLISGGGSALVEQPLDPGVTLRDFQELHSALVTCGAPIEEINVVRKHLSATKGGRLAAAAARSTKLTFALSDVPEGQESALASGPTVPDPARLDELQEIIRGYALLQKLPSLIARSDRAGKVARDPERRRSRFRARAF